MVEAVTPEVSEMMIANLAQHPLLCLAEAEADKRLRFVSTQLAPKWLNYLVKHSMLWLHQERWIVSIANPDQKKPSWMDVLHTSQAGEFKELIRNLRQFVKVRLRC